MSEEEAKKIIDNISKEEFPYALALAKAYERLEQENTNLKEQNKKLEILVECLKLGVVLNQEQEKLLDRILFGRGDSNVKN